MPKQPKSPYFNSAVSAKPPRSKEAIRAEENRMAEGAEPFVNVLVAAGNPVSFAGIVRYPGQTFSCRLGAAQRLVAQGRVSIV
jgi:hypothetical protein